MVSSLKCSGPEMYWPFCPYLLSIAAAQLSVIPRDYLHGFHKDHHSFSRLGCDHLACIIIQGASVTFPDSLAYPLDGFAVVADDCLSLNLDSPQFIISLTCLYKTGEPGISPQVDSLLRLSIRPENHLVIYQPREGIDGLLADTSALRQ